MSTRRRTYGLLSLLEGNDMKLLAIFELNSSSRGQVFSFDNTGVDGILYVTVGSAGSYQCITTTAYYISSNYKYAAESNLAAGTITIVRSTLDYSTIDGIEGTWYAFGYKDARE